MGISINEIDTPEYNIEQRNLLPQKPGIYLFYDETKTLIYVGKAKNIRKRVASYFTKNHQLNRKTKKLVSEVTTIRFAIAPSEFDALLLENNFIKENQPKYNILLKDDKTFPYICIMNERFPRVISTREYDLSQGEYFGPYTSVVGMKNVLNLIRKLYTIRTCSLNLSEKNIESGKFKVCLEYHIKNCLGPCEGHQDEASYNEEIDQARQILKGNLSVVKNHFKHQMDVASEQLEFEKAQKFKDKLNLLDKFQSKSVVVNPKLTNLEVITLIGTNKKAFVNYLRIQNGAIIAANTVEVKKKLEEDDVNIIRYVLLNFRGKYGEKSMEVLSNIEFELDEQSEVIVPKIGDKKKLVDLSLRNALEYKRKKITATRTNKPKEVILQLQEDLRLEQPPMHIECFDNSNLGGTNPVAAMVCFKNALPAKKEYRHYNIRTVEGPDDFASMREIVHRRYRRLLDENSDLPDLIVIDGGKGQLSSACTALKDLDLYGKIPIVGIAKRLEELYYPDDPVPLHISKKSLSLRLLQHLRDEAHRFAINFHRLKRSQNAYNSELESIPGIGKQTAVDLLNYFKSVKKIKTASTEEIATLVGPSKAQKISDFFHKKRE